MLATIRSAVKSIVVEEGTEVTNAMIEHATCELVSEVNNSRSRDKYKVWMLKKQTMILFCNNNLIKFYGTNGEVNRTLNQSALYRFWKKGYGLRTPEKTLNYFTSSLKKFTPEFVHHHDCKTESSWIKLAKKYFNDKMDLICTALLERCKYEVDGYQIEFNDEDELDIKLSKLQNLRP